MDDMTENAKEIKKDRSGTYKTIMRVLWALTILGIIGVVVLFYALSNSNLPSFEELENPKSDQASQVFAEDNSTLGRYCLLYTSPSPRDRTRSRMPSSA